jgi:hypothetical protein
MMRAALFSGGSNELIELIFHTNRQQSQITVFYLLWFMASADGLL